MKFVGTQYKRDLKADRFMHGYGIIGMIEEKGYVPGTFAELKSLVNSTPVKLLRELEESLTHISSGSSIPYNIAYQAKLKKKLFKSRDFTIEDFVDLFNERILKLRARNKYVH